MKHTVIKPFVFRGQSFNTGDMFDTEAEAVHCDPYRARTLMNQRYITPGFDDQKGASKPPTGESGGNITTPPSEPENGDSGAEEPSEPETQEDEGETDPENEPEGSEPEAQSETEPEAEQDKQPVRTSRRRS